MASPSAFPTPHDILPNSSHTHTIIALHGRGSNGPDFAEELFEGQTSLGLNLREAFPTYKWVFPTSQERYSTVFQQQMDEWFDIYSLGDPSQREELQIEGLKDSIVFLHSLIEDEAKLVTPSRLIILGISQGCATGLLALLASEYMLGAFVGLSGWMPFRGHIEEATKEGPPSQVHSRLRTFFQSNFGLRKPASIVAESSVHTPVFLGHASDDEVIDIELGRQMRTALEGLGTKVEWKENGDCGHWIKEPAEFDDIVKFLSRAMEEKPSWATDRMKFLREWLTASVFI
ncbi:hypothetical protein MMC28_011010 [Mycoblastus sanguinarius]|nr:hypothetical protein [Mycoblastus sanguinarius]